MRDKRRGLSSLHDRWLYLRPVNVARYLLAVPFWATVKPMCVIIYCSFNALPCQTDDVKLIRHGMRRGRDAPFDGLHVCHVS